MLGNIIPRSMNCLVLLNFMYIGSHSQPIGEFIHAFGEQFCSVFSGTEILYLLVIDTR